MSSLRMPIPVSFTDTSMITELAMRPASSMEKVIVPVSVYFTALVSRFMMTCSMRTSSPKSSEGSVLSTLTMNSRFLSLALSEMELTRLLIMPASSYLTGIISILPSSILEKSSMLLMMVRSVLPADLIFPEYSRMPSSSDSLYIISFMPRMALMGVLISWDIWAKNLLLDSPAAMAASAAACILRLV